MKEFVDILLKLELPSWVTLLAFVLGVIGLSIYKYKFECKIKDLSNNLEMAKINYQKSIDFIQERHKKKLDALDEISIPLNEFRHALQHLENGDSFYAVNLKEYYTTSRTLARKYEILLGEEFELAVHKMTESGLSILQANFILPKDEFYLIEEIPEQDRPLVSALAGKEIAVSEAQKILSGINAHLHQQTGRIIFSRCEISEEFNRRDFNDADSQIRKLAGKLVRTLPVLPTPPSGVTRS